MNGKGRGPMKGYNWQKYADNYDQIFRKPTKPKRLKTMKTNQDGKQPAPVLAWHREAARMLAADSKRFCEISVYMTPDWIAEHIAAHDPHAAHHATTVRLLEESFTVVSNLGSTLAMISSPDTRWESPMMQQYREYRDRVRAHLAALQQEGAAK